MLRANDKKLFSFLYFKIFQLLIFHPKGHFATVFYLSAFVVFECVRICIVSFTNIVVANLTLSCFTRKRPLVAGCT